MLLMDPAQVSGHILVSPQNVLQIIDDKTSAINCWKMIKSKVTNGQSCRNMSISIIVAYLTLACKSSQSWPFPPQSHFPWIRRRNLWLRSLCSRYAKLTNYFKTIICMEKAKNDHNPMTPASWCHLTITLVHQLYTFNSLENKRPATFCQISCLAHGRHWVHTELLLSHLPLFCVRE